MLKVNFVHTAEHAHISNDGKVSVINIFDIMYSDGVPTLSRFFYLVINATGEIGHHKVYLRLIDPEGNYLGQGSVWESDITEGKKNIGHILKLGMIALPKFGAYFLEIEDSGRKEKIDIFKLERHVNGKKE
ncbi:MAG: hypothetical protein V1668_02925 [Patescibacteria group bacterium]